MIRISLFLAFFSLVTVVSGQDAYSVFLDEGVVSWYHDTVNEYNQSVKNLASDDATVRIESRKNIKDILRKLDSNTQSMVFKMSRFLDKEKNKELSKVFMSDGVSSSALEERNKQFRKNKNFTELKMTYTEFDDFKDNLEKIKTLDAELATADYQLMSANQKTSTKLEQLEGIYDSAKANSEILLKTALN